MAKKKIDSEAGEGGPPYDANWIVDASQAPETLIERHSRNAANPQAADVYRQKVERKAAEFGLIHIDPATGYRARFKPASDAA